MGSHKLSIGILFMVWFPHVLYNCCFPTLNLLSDNSIIKSNFPFPHQTNLTVWKSMRFWVLAFLDFGHKLGEVSVIERHCGSEHRIKNDPHAPYITLGAKVLSAMHYFRCSIERTTAVSGKNGTRVSLFGKSEICNLEEKRFRDLKQRQVSPYSITLVVCANLLYILHFDSDSCFLTSNNKLGGLNVMNIIIVNG